MVVKKIEYIKDSVHPGIFISDTLILDLLKTKELIRLQRIRQLGFMDFHFPGATHTRYSHSLGVYYLIEKVVSSLNQNITNITKTSMLAAGIIHDIGHGPLSHNFEEITNIDHETITINLLNDESTDVYKVFKKFHPNIKKETIQILKGKHKIQWCNQLISSQIDMDKIDYLLRDSLHTGAHYGKVDISWLLRNMSIVRDKLVFDKKAVTTLESIVINRYHMFNSVYKNIKSTAREKLWGIFFNELKKQSIDGSLNWSYDEILFLFNESKFNLKKFLDVDDYVIHNIMRKASSEDNQIISRVAKTLLNNLKFEIITRNLSLHKDQKLYWKFTIKNEYKSLLKKSDNPVLIYDIETDTIRSLSEVSYLIGIIEENISKEKKLNNTTIEFAISLI